MHWEWVKDYWWIIIIFIIGLFYNTIKEMMKVDHRPYLNQPKPEQKNYPTSTDEKKALLKDKDQNQQK